MLGKHHAVCENGRPLSGNGSGSIDDASSPPQWGHLVKFPTDNRFGLGQTLLRRTDKTDIFVLLIRPDDNS